MANKQNKSSPSSQGQSYEDLAKYFLQNQGLVLVAQNWHYRPYGEIDLIMLAPETTNEFSANLINSPIPQETLVFIEVRKRRSHSYGGALPSITPSKQQKIITTAQAFLQQNPQFAQHACRFDVVAFDTSSKNTADFVLELDTAQPIWIQSAFIQTA